MISPADSMKKRSIFAEKLYGKDNIISAVMHADELNIAMTEKYGKPIYHYHLHIMALPVVDKEVRWTETL